MIKYLRFQETPSTIRRNFRLRGTFLAATAFGTAGFAPLRSFVAISGDGL
jgi:hypothetical protein